MTGLETPSPSKTDAQIALLYERLRSAMAARPAPRIRTAVRLALASIALPSISASVLLIACWIVYAQRIAGLEVGIDATVRMLIVLALILVLALVSTLVAMWRGASGLGTGVVQFGFVVALVVPIYAVLALQGPAHVPDAAVAAVEISRWGGRCLLISATVGAGTLASLVVALRHAVPVATRLRGATLGAAAGAWAGLVVYLFCPSDELVHIVVGHVLPVAAFTLLGGVIAPPLLKP